MHASLECGDLLELLDAEFEIIVFLQNSGRYQMMQHPVPWNLNLVIKHVKSLEISTEREQRLLLEHYVGL